MAAVSERQSGDVQTLDALKKARRRAYMREYKEKNREKLKQIKWKYARRSRGQNDDVSEYRRNVESGSNYSLISLVKVGEIEVSLCGQCSRKYLTKLHCLWCNRNNYENTRHNKNRDGLPSSAL